MTHATFTSITFLPWIFSVIPVLSVAILEVD